MSRAVTHTDAEGRMSKVLIPDKAPDSNARYGIPVGPPDLSLLKLPKDTEVRLHNELFNRGILTYADAKKKRNDVVAALQRVLAVDADAIVNAFKESE